MRSFVVAKAVVVNDQGKILVLRRSQTDDRRPGQWDFPGGWIEQNEDLFAGVKREAVEEAGLTLKDPQLVFGFSEMTTHHGGGTWLFFVEHVTGQPDITLSYEHDAHAWKDPQALLKEITYDRQLKVLTYVIDNGFLDKD